MFDFRSLLSRLSSQEVQLIIAALTTLGRVVYDEARELVEELVDDFDEELDELLKPEPEPEPAPKKAKKKAKKAKPEAKEPRSTRSTPKR